MTRTPTRSNPTVVCTAATIACLLALSACGDDGDASTAAATEPSSSPATTSAATTTAPPATTEAPATTSVATSAPTTAAPTTTPSTEPDAGGEPALCAPYLEVSAAFAGQPDPATIGGLLDAVDAAAPAELADQLTLLTEGARTVLETGDFSVFERPEFDEAIVAADSWVFENCAFVTTTELVATDYSYAGQAEAYPAGRTAFVLINEGVEAHELAILRKADGVELSLAELMELPQAEAEQMASYIGATFVGPTGDRANLVVDLPPGNYIAVCNVPSGTVVADDGSFVEGAGEPHVMLGMSFEFTVS